MAIEIFQNSLQPLIEFLRMHPNYSGLIAFGIVFCEALAVIGVLIPGTITMTAIGVLIGYGVIPAFSTFVWAIFGAILGDYLSYLIGVYYKNKLHRMWPFSKHPKLLTKGEKFFHTHGGKSIFIGRFVGPMRAMLPTIAGMLKMPQGRFLVAAIPSASLWAVLYILPGVLLGAFALQLPAKLAAKFLLWIMLAVVVAWCTSWLAHHFLKRVCRFIDHYIKRLWLYLSTNRTWRWLPKFLADPRRPDNHQQLTLLILTIVFSALFIVTFFFTKEGGILNAWNEPVFYLLRSIRTEMSDHIMLLITSLADTKVIVLIQLIFITYLATKRYWYALIHTIAVMWLCYFSLQFIKILVHAPRPPGFLSYLMDFSFPSGHTASSIAIYGFFATIIASELRVKIRWIPYAILSVISALIALSRLYLGAHWLIDVIGGAWLGLAILFATTLSYRRRHADVKPLKTSIIIVTIMGIVLVLYSMNTFQQQMLRYSPHPPNQSITLNAWRAQGKRNAMPIIPLYRNDRLGHPISALNIEWIGDLNTIEKDLIANGWQSHAARFNFEEILLRLAIKNPQQKLPILPQLYNNHREVLLFTKQTDGKKPILILRLWDSNININDFAQNLWLGSIEFYKPPKPVRHSSALIAAMPHLKLADFDITAVRYSKARQPEVMRNLNWDGRVLMIESK